MRAFWVSMVVACLFTVGGAQAAPTHEQLRDENDRKLVSELEALAPESVPLLSGANDAYRAERWKEAEAKYLELGRRVPKFTAALRRACAARLGSGRRAEAIALCREAAADGSSDNLQMLARALAVPPQGAGELDEARRLAERAADMTPDDVFAQYSLCEVLARQGLMQTGLPCYRFVRERGPANFAAGVLLAQALHEVSRASLRRTTPTRTARPAGSRSRATRSTGSSAVRRGCRLWHPGTRRRTGLLASFR
jgi:tetratricopeptide (TPR) repeat protein